jgi:nitrogen fixation protein FixH
MRKPLTGKKVLTILLSVFAVVFAVNGFMIYSAVSTFSGVQRGATYRMGLHYNNTFAEQQAQDELRWSHQAQFSHDAPLAVTVRDASGSPVAGLAIEGWLGPSSDRADRRLTFKGWRSAEM